MILYSNINKATLEILIKNIFLNFGNFAVSQLVNSIKVLGFLYATSGGISISIEDLKISLLTDNILKSINTEIINKTLNWQEGKISDLERFESIMNNWNIATEHIKEEIISCYKNLDPLNCVFLMSNSGARGNMSQIRQLIGLRGLMSDQEGNVIDVPIKSSFCKGLSSIDYVISAYGARKGVVDTAIKTAQAGYLTRRLIFLCQSIIIRHIDCKTQNGVITSLSNKVIDKNLLGHFILSIKNKYNTFVDSEYKNKLITDNLIQTLKLLNIYTNDSFFIKFRSSITCNNNFVCQKCYGYDLSKNEIVSLGEVIGTIAAQSIGEPGTQLTMRTFHTGGVFVANLSKKKSSFTSGKILLPKNFKYYNYKDLKKVAVKKPIKPIIMNWSGIINKIILPAKSNLLFNKLNYIHNIDLSNEKLEHKPFVLNKKLKPLITKENLEIYKNTLNLSKIPISIENFKEVDLYGFNKISVLKHIIKNRKNLFVNLTNGYLKLGAGENISIYSEFEKIFPNYALKYKSYSKAKIISNYVGISYLFEKKFFILTSKFKYYIDLNKLNNIFSNKNKKIQIYSLLRNYQYVDKFTQIINILILPLFSEKIIQTKLFDKKYEVEMFLRDQSQILKINLNPLKNIFFNFKSIGFKEYYNDLIYSKVQGVFLKKNGSNFYYQNCIQLFLEKGVIMKPFKKKIINSNSVIAKSITYPLQSNDIVQGLPKISQLVNATCPKRGSKCKLSISSGIILDNNCFLHDALCSAYEVPLKTKHFYNLNNGIEFKQAISLYKESDTSVYGLKPNLNLFFHEQVKKNIENTTLENPSENERLSKNLSKKNKLSRRLSVKLSKKNELSGILQKKNIFSKKYIDKSKKNLEKEEKEIEKLKKNIEKVENNITTYVKEELEKIKLFQNEVFVFQHFSKNLPLLYIKNKFWNFDKISWRDRAIARRFSSFKFFFKITKLFDIQIIKHFGIIETIKDFYVATIGGEELGKMKNKDFNNNTFDKRKYLLFAKPSNFEDIKPIKKINLMEEVEDKFMEESEDKATRIFFKQKLKDLREIGEPKETDIPIIYNKDKRLFIPQVQSPSDSIALLHSFYGNKVAVLNEFAKNAISLQDDVTNHLNSSVLYRLKEYNSILKYKISSSLNLFHKLMDYVDIGEPLSEGYIDPHNLLAVLYYYHLYQDKIQSLALYNSIYKFRLILLNSITSIYESQGVNIDSKHIEIICRQLTTDIYINSLDPLLNELYLSQVYPGEKISLSLFATLNNLNPYLVKCSPIFKSSISTSVSRRGFFSAASFQFTKKVLTKASFLGTTDLLSGLKEQVMTGKTIFGGTNYFLDKKNDYCLDKIQYYKII